MLLSHLRAPAQRLLRPLALGLGRLGLKPDGLTLLGLALNVAAGIVLASGRPLWGAAAVLAASAFDMLDGVLARESGRTTRFGAFLDSTTDRYAEAALFAGILAWHVQGGQIVEALLAYAAIIGSLLVSYTRARAEGLGLVGETGWLPRPERIVLLACGLALGAFWPALWTATLGALALLAHITAVQRIVHVRRQLREGEPPEAGK